MDNEKRLAELRAKREELKRDGKKLPDKEFQELLRLERALLKKGGFKPGNDINWWNKYRDLLNDAINFVPAYVPGDDLEALHYPFSPVGVMRVLFHNTWGRQRGKTSPLNVWARDLYLSMYQKYRAIDQYQPSDLGVYILATLEVVCLICKLERIYGVVTRYSKVNINMPRTEIEALGLTQSQADWVKDNLSDFRFDLNILIEKAQRLYIPKNMSVIANKLSLLGYEYLDHDNAKAQIVIFDIDHVGLFDETSLSTGGCVRYLPLVVNGTNVSNISLFDTTANVGDNMFSGLEMLIDNILDSTGNRQIIRDLTSWFTEENSLKFEPLQENYRVIPVYSKEMLHKLHNIDPFDWGGGVHLMPIISNALSTADKTAMQSFGQYCVYQVGGDIFCDHTVFLGTVGTTYSAVSGIGQVAATTAATHYTVDGIPTLLDSYHENFDETVRVEGLLWKECDVVKSFTSSGTTYYYEHIISCAFEMVTEIKLFTLSAGADSVSAATTPTLSTSGSNANFAGQLSIVDWAPICYHANTAANSVYIVYGDLDQVALVSVNAKVKTHRAIILSGMKPEMVAVSMK